MGVVVSHNLKHISKALEAGISESRMSRIVNRRVAIQEHERRHLARVLGINLEETSDEHSTPQ